MSISPNRAPDEQIPVVEGEEIPDEPHFDQLSWTATRDEEAQATPGGRMVLGWGLALLAMAWIGYTGWSAGRALAGEPLTSPAIAQWIAILAGPLALMGLVWLMFGRTRRKEAERFTRSVIAMRTEARSLQDLLGALSRQIHDNHRDLGVMAGDLMSLGDQAASRLGNITAQLQSGSAQLAEHGDALDRAAESARTDIGVLLSDLPQAEETAKRMAEMLREAGRTATEQAQGFEAQVGSLSSAAGSADTAISEASASLSARLAEIEQASRSATERLEQAGTEIGATVDTLLARAAEALAEVRSGIDGQAAAVAALVEQAEAGLGRAGAEAAHQLSERLGSAGSALDGLSARIAEQERASQRLIADLDGGLAALDERFLDLARTGDERASHVQIALGRLRGELEGLITATAGQDEGISGLAARTAALREGVEQLGIALQGEMATALDHAEGGASRLLTSAEAARPHVEAMRDAAGEAERHIRSSADSIAAQHDQLGHLMTSIDLGVGQTELRLGELSAAIAAANEEVTMLSAQTGPALVAALLQVREAAAHAAERARETIASVIPESAGQLSDAARSALERAVRESVEAKLSELNTVAAHAVESARNASDRLTQQMLSIGQSAAALEEYIERSREAQRKDSGEEFARRVSLLIDSMHSASIDVQKILSDEVDEKAWNSYLKGNRDVFTRRAVRLIGGTETRTIATQYDSDPEFQLSVNRYVHDFEAMLRRILAERDGGTMAVTLMSSDIGKLYAALSQAIDRRR